MNNKSLQRISNLINQLQEVKENEITINSCSENEIIEKKEIEQEDFEIETGYKKLDFEIISEKVEENEIITLNKTSENEIEKKDDKKEQRYLTITDSETGKTIKVPVFSEHINASDLKKLNITLFDPGYMNTSVARSKITFIDGDKGILEYRGYNIEDLASRATFEEVSFLLINGVLPTKTQLSQWNDRIMKHTYLHKNLTELLKQFRYDAHPMGMIISTISALSTFYPEANPALQGSDLYTKKSKDTEKLINKQIFRILGKIPVIASYAYRNRIGKPYNLPQSNLGYTENFLYMLDRLSESEYKPHPKLAKALDTLFILHADHELNCSTACFRHISSASTDPFSAISGAVAALYGPLHGGACEAVLHMLEEIKTVENIPQFIQDVKDKKKKLMGFGHRIYKSYDPRAKIARKVADDVFAILGKEPLIEIAEELEKVALKDKYFIERNLYPNIDFYTGLIYKSLGFPTDMFPVLFAIPRCAGWLAHWVESLDDKDLKIYRPKQIYDGAKELKFIPISSRVEESKREILTSVSSVTKRREV